MSSRPRRAAVLSSRQVLYLAIGLAGVAAVLLALSFAFRASDSPALLALSRGLRDPGWFALLGALVLGAVAYALRPRLADGPASVEPGWFPDSTEFARSTLMPPQEPAHPQRREPATQWSARVFEDIDWRRVEELCAELSAQAGTPGTLKLDRDKGISTHEGEKLLALIAQRTPGQQQALLARAYQGEYWRPTCPSCGQKMVSRSARQGGKDFWGCADFPRCRSTMAMRG